MSHEVISERSETKDTGISPKYLITSLIILITSLVFHFMYSINVINGILYFYALIYAILFTLGQIFILISQMKIAKKEELNRKQKTKMIISSIFHILSSVFILTITLIGEGDISGYYLSHIDFLIMDKALIVILLFFIFQGVFQLVGHILFRSAMKDVTGKTKLVVNIGIISYVIAGLLLFQVVSVCLLANTYLLNVSMQMFRSLVIIIPVVSFAIYVIEIILLKKIDAIPVEVEKKIPS